MVRRLIAALAMLAFVAGGTQASFAASGSGAPIVLAKAEKGKSSKAKKSAKAKKSSKAKKKSSRARKAARAKARAFRVEQGQTTGPLTVANPPYDAVVNDGTITNGGQSGVPALTTTGYVTVTNNGAITATAGGGGGSGAAVGVLQE